MTLEKFQGVSLDEQIQRYEEESEVIGKKTKKLKEESEVIDKKKKELKELKELRDEIEIEVIKELEKKYDFKGFNENMSDFIEKFDDFLDSLNDYIKTGSDTSKTSLLEKIPILKDINNILRNMENG